MTKPSGRLPKRAENAHKGDSGAVLIVAGSRRLAGAAALCALGAGRSGAGFLRIAGPGSALDRIGLSSPDRILLAQRETRSGELSFSSLADLLDLASAADALVLGPGLGRSEDLSALVAALIVRLDLPMVLDADALFALGESGLESLLGKHEVVITPHGGEAARLLGCELSEIEGGREAAVAELARRSGATAILKGAGSLICKGDRLHRNETGNPGMATAGMGDVLAGMIGGLLAGGMTGFDAAACAVHAHGLAGDLALAALGADRGLQASDLEHFIPRALAGFSS